MPPPTGDVAASGRRDRQADLGSAVLADALATKVLHGWLQNRHQTLVPLTLNFRVLTPEQRQAIIDGLATLLLAGRPRADASAAAPGLRHWLAGLGAEPEALTAFDRALVATPPIDGVFERAAALDLAVYLYVAAITASDPKFPASLILADVVQARFDLPNAVIRSATRRYRR